MTTIREMLPAPAKSFAEVIIGAGIGALIGGYVVKRKATEGAIVGALAGYGLQLSSSRGAWPFTSSTVTAGYYTGDDVIQLGPTPAPQIIEEEVVPTPIPEWQTEYWRRHHGWRGGEPFRGERYWGHRR